MERSRQQADEMGRPNPYRVIPATVCRVIEESPRIKTFVLRPEEPFSFRAGQFIELTVPGVGEAPFTPSSSPYEQDYLEVTVMEVGFVTRHLHRVQEGAVLGIRGPYGNYYPLEDFKAHDLLLVGGGVGLAPLRSLLLTVLHDIEEYRRVWACFGARTPQDLIYKDLLFACAANGKVCLRLSVDRVPESESWDGKVCLVTGLLDEVAPDPATARVVVCGPPVMMKYATLALLARGYREEHIYLSMERKMYCGLGHCRHCLIGPYHVCREGPVFTYAAIKDEENIWE